jgi:hypothetical protein
MTTIAVTGGRNFDNVDFINQTLDRLNHDLSIKTMLNGECRTGADLWAKQWALKNRKDLILLPANWGGRGMSAGPYRNRLMLNILKAIEPRPLLVAFPGGTGTADCVAYAHLVGIEVRTFVPKKTDQEILAR